MYCVFGFLVVLYVLSLLEDSNCNIFNFMFFKRSRCIVGYGDLGFLLFLNLGDWGRKMENLRLVWGDII